MKRKVFCMAMFMAAALYTGGCSMPGLFGFSTFVYDNADKYTMGNAELNVGEIKSLEVDWISGEIKIEYHEKDTVVISETANKTLDEDTTMYYLVDGDTLRVKFAKSGKYNFEKLEKELTVWLPEGIELKSLEVDSVSADVSVWEIAAAQAEIDTTSGSVAIEDMMSERAEIDTTSGDITAKFAGELAWFSADSVSGDMELALSATKIELDTTSGAISLVSETAPEQLSADSVSGSQEYELPGAKTLDLNSTSGQIRVSAQTAPDAVSVNTVSGDVVFCLPEDADFTVRWDSVSGKVSSELSMTQNKDDYIFGNGTKKYRVETTSGDLTVKCE